MRSNAFAVSGKPESWLSMHCTGVMEIEAICKVPGHGKERSSGQTALKLKANQRRHFEGSMQLTAQEVRK